MTTYLQKGLRSLKIGSVLGLSFTAAAIALHATFDALIAKPEVFFIAVSATILSAATFNTIDSFSLSENESKNSLGDENELQFCKKFEDDANYSNFSNHPVDSNDSTYYREIENLKRQIKEDSEEISDLQNTANCNTIKLQELSEEYESSIRKIEKLRKEYERSIREIWKLRNDTNSELRASKGLKELEVFAGEENKPAYAPVYPSPYVKECDPRDPYSKASAPAYGELG